MTSDMVPRPGMMTILLILILGRLGQTAVRTAKPDSPNSATRPATAEYIAELSHDPLARSAHARFDESFFAAGSEGRWSSDGATMEQACRTKLGN